MAAVDKPDSSSLTLPLCSRTSTSTTSPNSTTSPRSFGQCLDKENVPQLQAKTIKNANLWEMMREVDKLKEQLTHEKKLRLQAEAQAGMGRNAKKSASDAQQQIEHLVKENQDLREQCGSLSARSEKAKHQCDFGGSSTVHEDDVERLEPDEIDMASLMQRAAKDAVCEQFAEMEDTLNQLKIRTKRNEERMQSLGSCSCKADWLELRNLAKTRIEASKIVHGAVIRGLLATKLMGEEESEAAKQDEVAALTRALQEAHKEAVDLKESEAAKQEEVASLTRTLQEAHKEAVDLKESKAAKQEAVASLTRAIQEAHNEAADLKEIAAAKDLKTATLVQKLKATREEATALKDQNSSLEKKLEEKKVGQGTSTFDHELNERNRQLLTTLEQFTHEHREVEAENKSLRESVKAFEESLEKMAGQHAELMGHVNHKQKIKHTMQLKEENLKLKDEVRRLRKECYSLQVSQRGSRVVLEALPSLSSVLPASSRSISHAPSPRKHPVQELCAPSPRLTPLTTPQKDGTPTPRKCGAAPRRPSSARLDSVRTRLCKEADVSVDGVLQDFSHAQMLMERATADYDNVQCRDFSSLLSRLRAVVADRRGHQVASQQ